MSWSAPEPSPGADGSPPALRIDVAALVYILAAVVAAFWFANPTAFLTEDAYFYLVSARRFAHGEGQTFSGVFATNGFHPLWLYVLYGWAKVSHLIAPTSLLSARFVAVPASVCLVVGTHQLLGVARRLRLSPAAMAGIPTLYVGVLGILGSEGHLLFAAASSLLLRLTTPRAFASDRDAVLTGALASLVVLARLDSIFWIVALFATRRMGRSHELPLRRIVLSGAVCILILLPYLLSNVLFFGGIMPISGWLKSSFPRLRAIQPSGSLLGAFRGYNNPFGHAPILLGLISYRAWARQRSIVLPLLIGCFSHDVYTTLFGSYSEWYWYYVTNVLLAAFCLACIVDRLSRRRTRELIATVIALAGVSGLIALRRHSAVASAYAFEPTKFLNDLGPTNETVLVGDTPGYIAFYSDDEIVSADLLTGSRKLFDRISRDENPLRALFRAHAEAGHPFTYVVWDENRWLGASSDWRTLHLFHPKNGHDGESFGSLPMPPPILIRPHVVIWKVQGLSL